MSGVPVTRFNGQDIYLPGYYAKRVVSKAARGGASGSVIAVLGSTEGGVPYNAASVPDVEKQNWVSGDTDLKAVLRAGDGFYGAKFVLTPTTDSEIGRPAAAMFIRVDPATQSTMTLKDGSALDVIDLTSRDYGLWTNDIRVKVATGTTAGTKKVSTKLFDSDGNEITQEIDNIQRIGFTLNYAQGGGTGTTALFGVDHDGNFTTTIGVETGDNLTLSLATYDTLVKLVTAINAFAAAGTYTAVLTSDANYPTAKLDDVSGIDCYGGVTADVKADCWAVIEKLQESGEAITADLTSAADHEAPTNVDWDYMTGAVTGSAAQTQWDGALSLIEKFDISYVVVVTDDAAIHASLAAHVAAMNSTLGRKERRGYCGGLNTLTDAQHQTAAAALNSGEVTYVADPQWRYDRYGVLTEFHPKFAACGQAGMKAGNPKTFTPTWKPVSTVKLSVDRSRIQQEAMVRAGCHIFVQEEGGSRFWCPRAVTTYQGTNLILNEESIDDTILFITKDHRIFMQNMFVARPGRTGVDKAMESASKLRLEKYVDDGLLVVDPATGDAYRNHSLVIEGVTWKIEYEGTVVAPINNILATHNFVLIGQA